MPGQFAADRRGRAAQLHGDLPLRQPLLQQRKLCALLDAQA
jgi:hypothetical protein